MSSRTDKINSNLKAIWEMLENVFEVKGGFAKQMPKIFGGNYLVKIGNDFFVLNEEQLKEREPLVATLLGKG